MGFKVLVNGEEVWESDEEANAVDRVSVMTSKGEASAVGSAADNEWVNILVNIRNAELTSDLDLLEAERQQVRREKLESVTSGRTGGSDPYRGDERPELAGVVTAQPSDDLLDMGTEEEETPKKSSRK